MNFKVIKGEIGGNGNKVFKPGDKVTEMNFPKGNAEALVKLGFLEAVKDEAPKLELETETETKPKPSGKKK